MKKKIKYIQKKTWLSNHEFLIYKEPEGEIGCHPDKIIMLGMWKVRMHICFHCKNTAFTAVTTPTSKLGMRLAVFRTYDNSVKSL